MSEAAASIENLEPNALWRIFHLFTQHPRSSRHEDAVLSAIELLCDQHDLSHKRDDIGNLIITKAATAGMENRQTVVMQGHIDMVPQKNADSSHDFLTDPIVTQIKDGWVTAKGTTLGADNGIGVAAALAVLISKDIVHGPLEVLITIDEESGMTGAEHLKPGWLQADILLNLDTEDEGELYVGCAGGVDITATFSMDHQNTAEPQLAYELAVTGLRGGHSGLDIHTGRANANKIINEFLQTHLTALSIQVSRFSGGTLRNAIAREAFCSLVIPKEKQDALINAVKQFEERMRNAYVEIEDNLSVSLKAIDRPKQVYTTASCQTILNAVEQCVHGVAAMSPDFADTVESSNNLAIVKSSGDQVEIICLARSLSDAKRDQLADKIVNAFNQQGALAKQSGQYPGWQPNPESNMLTLMLTVHESLFGFTPKVKVIHAGLECGLLNKPYPHWDMISFGPNIRHAHSPDEKVEIRSVEAFWKLLLATLSSIPEKTH